MIIKFVKKINNLYLIYDILNKFRVLQNLFFLIINLLKKQELFI